MLCLLCGGVLLEYDLCVQDNTGISIYIRGSQILAF
jgi:hypothetical protein